METEPTKDAIKVLGTKRPTPDCPLNPHHNLPVNVNSPNRHLVYVRRKFEAELGKNRTSDKEHTAAYPDSGQFDHKGDVTHQQNLERDPTNADFSTSIPVSMAYMMPLSEASSTPVSLLKHNSCISPGVHPGDLSSKTSLGVNDLHWKVRCTQLYTYLENCDRSNQEAYIKLVRSFTPVERSRHAVELEKRAMRLVLEEGREMHRVKVLNVLGKSTRENYL